MSARGGHQRKSAVGRRRRRFWPQNAASRHAPAALHKKSISTGFVSDPLPLRGRPPLQGGQKTVLNQRTFLPLEKGSRERSERGGQFRTFCAPLGRLCTKIERDAFAAALQD